MEDQSFCVEEYLSLLLPYFSETSTLFEDAETIGTFLTAMMPVEAVMLSRFVNEKLVTENWFSERGCVTELFSSEYLSHNGSSLLALMDSNGIAAGQELDRLMRLDKDIHAIAYEIYYDKHLGGIFTICRRGGLWNNAERRVLSTLRELTGAVYNMRISIENESRSNFVFNTVMDGMKASIYITEVDTDRILFMNQAMKEDFGIKSPEGKICYKVLQKGMTQRCRFCPVDRLISCKEETPVIQWDELNTVTGRSYRNYDSLIKWMDGSIVHLQQSIDVTELKTANTDELTQLLSRRPGKTALQETLDQALTDGRLITVCFYDINNLKEVNDRFGHKQGDYLIASAASAVQEVLQKGEYAFRLSGDEFVVVFLTEQKNVQERLSKALKRLQASSDEYEAGFCYGLVEITPERPMSAEEALILADERMYRQKQRFHIMRNEEQRQQIGQPQMTSAYFQYDKEQLYNALSESTDDYPFICNMKTGYFRYAPAMVEEFGLPGEVIENAAAVWGSKVHENDKAAFLEANQMITDGRADSHCVEYRAVNRRGEWVWVRCRGQVKNDQNGDPCLFAGFISKLDHKNKVDHITGLYNKIEFEEHVCNQIERFPGEPFGVVLLGMDDLKHINDLYDRTFGDEVVRMTAQRLQSLLPVNALLYKMDGDEFAVFIRDIGKEDLQKICRSINYNFEGQQELEGKKYYCTLSGGSVLYPQDAKTYLEIIKFSGYCMELAKRQGKNCCCSYFPGILDDRARALEMVDAMRESIENEFDGFSLKFQPLVEASTGRVLGAEALARYQCSRFGHISPMEFIPLLEQTGMIIPVGKWVLNKAVKQCSAWVEQASAFVLNVNLSYLQIQGTDFVPYVLSVLETHGFPACNLVLELTESCFVQDNQHVQNIFNQLRKYGVRTAVDDFGTGFSSLSSLKNIPADLVKIDKTFIRDIRTSTFDATFIQFVVALCRDVGISVCLEGVETEDEYQIVNKMGLNIIQGFLFGMPLTPEEFEIKFRFE